MRKHGWMLLQMTYVLVLLGVFSAMASELFVTTITVRREAERTERLCVQWSLLTEKLKRDAWVANKIEVESETLLRFLVDRGEMITWRIGENGSISRDELTWDGLGDGVTFESHGAGVAMHVDRLPIRGGGAYWLTSQVLLAEVMR